MGCVMDDEKVKYKTRDIIKKEGKTQFYNDTNDVVQWKRLILGTHSTLLANYNGKKDHI